MSTEISLERIIASRTLLVIGAIIVLVVLIVPIYWLAQHGLLTAITLTGFFTIVFWALGQSKLLDPQKQRWVSPTVVIVLISAFLFGFVGERTGSFYVTPLTEAGASVPPMFATIPALTSGTIALILAMGVLVVLVVALSVKRT